MMFFSGTEDGDGDPAMHDPFLCSNLCRVRTEEGILDSPCRARDSRATLGFLLMLSPFGPKLS